MKEDPERQYQIRKNHGVHAEARRSAEGAEKREPVLLPDFV